MNDTTPQQPAAVAGGARLRSGVRRWLGPLLRVPTPVIFVVAAAVATLLLWRQGSLGNVAISVQAAGPGAIAGILLVYGVSLLALGLRWHALVRMVGGDPPWSASAEVFFTSVIINYAAPIGLAVPTRAALTVRDLGLRPGPSAAVVAWEAALDVGALALISLLWLLAGGSELLAGLAPDGRTTLVAMAAVAAVAAIAVAGVWGKPIGTRIGAAGMRWLAFPRERPGLAVAAALLTAAFWAMQSGVMAALLMVFGVTVTMPLLLGVMGLPVLIGMVSPVPGGAGVREGLMAAAAQLEGVAAAPVVLAAVAYRIALFIVTPVVWAVARMVRSIGRGR